MCVVYYSVASAWIGVNELNGALSFVSNPERNLSYVPTWFIPTDATKKCVTVTVRDVERQFSTKEHGGWAWEAFECQDSGISHTTLCRVPPFDEFGYNLETGKCKLHLYPNFIIIH